MIDLQRFVDDYAAGLVAVDARRPVAVNQRTGEAFQPGIGPHSEVQTVRLVISEMKAAHARRYDTAEFDVRYPDKPRQKCDIAVTSQGETLYVESKLLRFLGDNGKPNDNILTHLLSPYPQHRSALTDCAKLRDSGFDGYRAVLIFGYESEDWPLEPAIDAFEVIANAQCILGPRLNAQFSGLCHPVHSAGHVYMWEML